MVHCYQRFLKAIFPAPRQQFEKIFDFLSFNKELVTEYGSGHYIIAIAPSFINKAGKKTPGIGYLWSGCAGAVKRGLEILYIAIVYSVAMERNARR